MAQFGIVIGIDKNNDIEAYRVIVATANKKADKQYDWSFDCKMMQSNDIINSMKSGGKWINITVEAGKLKGSAGALSRFNNNPEHKPYVIISQITNLEGKLLGYKVANYNGNVKNISLKEMLAYGNRYSKRGFIPVQNAIFVPADEEKHEHYKSYPNSPFITEVITSSKNKYVEKKRLSIQKNEKALNRLEEIYTKEQLVQLKKGKISGVDIRIYANPALSAEQMKVLREGLEDKVNVKAVAFPEYKVQAMKYYILDLKNGADIRKYLSPKYDIGQISELSLATELGLDISKMANPSLKADEMAEIRERLEKNVWKDWLVNKDGSWK